MRPGDTWAVIVSATVSLNVGPPLLCVKLLVFLLVPWLLVPPLLVPFQKPSCVKTALYVAAVEWCASSTTRRRKLCCCSEARRSGRDAVWMAATVTSLRCMHMPHMRSNMRTCGAAHGSVVAGPDYPSMARLACTLHGMLQHRHDQTVLQTVHITVPQECLALLQARQMLHCDATQRTHRPTRELDSTPTSSSGNRCWNVLTVC